MEARQKSLRRRYPFLSTRALNVLGNHGWDTPEEMLAATDNGKNLLKYRQVGRKTQTELVGWALGLIHIRKGKVIRIEAARAKK